MIMGQLHRKAIWELTQMTRALYTPAGVFQPTIFNIHLTSFALYLSNNVIRIPYLSLVLHQILWFSKPPFKMSKKLEAAAIEQLASKYTLPFSTFHKNFM